MHISQIDPPFGQVSEEMGGTDAAGEGGGEGGVAGGGGGAAAAGGGGGGGGGTAHESRFAYMPPPPKKYRTSRGALARPGSAGPVAGARKEASGERRRARR